MCFRVCSAERRNAVMAIAFASEVDVQLGEKLSGMRCLFNVREI